MTQEEMRRLIDELSRPVPRPTPSQMCAQPVYQPQGFEPGVYHLSRDDEYMAERSWIKRCSLTQLSALLKKATATHAMCTLFARGEMLNALGLQDAECTKICFLPGRLGKYHNLKNQRN